MILNLTDDSVEVTEVEETENTLIAYVQKKDVFCVCDECGCKMESKGPRYRKVNHPILQDGRALVLMVKTRKWYCKSCNIYRYDSFNFVEKYNQSSNLTIFMILEQLKDLNLSFTQVAANMHVSDTTVHETFMRFVDLPRLPLCRVLCIDEVYLKFDAQNLYSVVLMNWETGDIIDILPNRFKSTLEKYMSNIPREERAVVQYLVSDMYDTYSDLCGKDSWLRNSTSVIDCFHHTQPIITMINNYINQVKKAYQKRDREKLKEENYRNNRDWKTRKDSREVYLLKNYDYFLLKNHDDIDFTPRYRHIKGRGGGYMFIPEKVEAEFMALDKNFPEILKQKEMYIHFTHSHQNDPVGAAAELDELITFYRGSHLAMFREFANTLDKHRDGIIASFTFLKAERSEANKEVLRRISNGPLESFNNVPKDYKRQSNGVRNFKCTRNRILWASRTDAAIMAVPYSRDEVHTAGKPRCPYKKGKDGK